jgi:ABC-2 type transport system ATP-binding protein
VEYVEPVVEAQALTKIYQRRSIALNNVSMTVARGTVLGLLGPNGAGKTTFLRIILGLQRQSSGIIKVFGQKMGPNASSLRRRIGYIPTHAEFPHGLTPLEYLDYVGKLFGLQAPVRKPRCAQMLRAVGLQDVAGMVITGFSSGMTSRLSVAASLMNEPELLIWDEPTHGLDPEARRSMLELIKQLSSEKTLIVSSHNLSDIDEVCSHTAVLSRGQLLFFGDLADMKGSGSGCFAFELELDCDAKSTARTAQALRDQKICEAVESQQRRLRVQLPEDQPNTLVLAQVFQSLSDLKVNVVDVRGLGQGTEAAFLDLVEKEESNGLVRLYRNAA